MSCSLDIQSLWCNRSQILNDQNFTRDWHYFCLLTKRIPIMSKLSFTHTEPPKELLVSLLSLFKSKQCRQLIINCKTILQNYPKSVIVRNLLGASYSEITEYKNAIQMFEEVLEIDPFMPDAYNNLASTFKKLGLIHPAIENFKKALELKPNYIEASLNLINILIDKRLINDAENYLHLARKGHPEHPEILHLEGIISLHTNDHDHAIKQLKKTIKQFPKFAEAHNSLGVVYLEMNNQDEAIKSFIKTLELDKKHEGAKQNLIDTLKLSDSSHQFNNQIIELDRQVREITKQISSNNTDDEIEKYICDALNLIEDNDPELETKFSQIFFRNGKDLNCKRHTTIFENNGIIPKFCFGCYKVQIEVSTLVDIIRLSKLFCDIDLPNNLTRKCMIEMRDEVAGKYKGYIYCSTQAQAQVILKNINAQVAKKLPCTASKIKRGCSEFAIKYPDYATLSEQNTEFLHYPENWGQIEQEFDQNYSFEAKPDKLPTSKVLGLSDLMIMRKWVDYAKGANDQTAHLFEKFPVKYNDIYEAGKRRTFSAP